MLAVILGHYGLECARRTICPRNVKIYTADTLLTTKNMLRVILETYGLWNEFLNLHAEQLCGAVSTLGKKLAISIADKPNRQKTLIRKLYKKLTHPYVTKNIKSTPRRTPKETDLLKKMQSENDLKNEQGLCHE